MSFPYELELCYVDDPFGDETGSPSLKATLQKWCEEHCKSEYSFKTTPPYFVCHYIIFQSKKDLAAFALRW